MKGTKITTWIIGLSAVLAISLFFMGARFPFHIFAWFSVVAVLFSLAPVAAKAVMRRKGKKTAPIAITYWIPYLALPCGFIFSKNVYDALLLGCAFFIIVGLLASLFLKQNETIRLEKDAAGPSGDEEEKDGGGDSVLSSQQLDKMVKESLRIDSFTIGEVFPWSEYVYPGDHVTPDLNMGGFDVVASFADLTPQEDQAFSTSEIKLSIFEYGNIPFILMNYDDVVRLQFSINIQKMKKGFRETWVRDEKNSLVRVYLLESNDGTLRGIRSFEMKMMTVLKRILSKQLSMTREEIDNRIRYAESLFDVRQMEVMAQYSEIVPRPGVIL